MTVSAKVNVDASVTQTQSFQGTSYTGSPKLSYSSAFPTTDIVWVVARSSVALASGASTTYNLLDGSTVDGFGNSVVGTHLKHFTVTNAGPGDLLVGGGSNSVISQYPSLASGGCYSSTGLWTISGSSKNFTVTASGSATTTSFVLWGN